MISLNVCTQGFFFYLQADSFKFIESVHAMGSTVIDVCINYL